MDFGQYTEREDSHSMKRGSKKSPLQPKTKEQILREMEISRKRKIVTEKFFPSLVAATVSVDEARMLVSATTSLIMEEAMRSMKVRKFSEIEEEVFKKLCPDGERAEEIRELLKVFSEETLFVSREIIEGAKQAIDQMVNDEMRTRSLSTLKADWNRYLN